MRSAGRAAFSEARNLLLRHRDDYERAYAEFRWPELDEFNWALDWFDTIATDETALWVVEEDGSEQKLSFRGPARSRRAGTRRHRRGRRRGRGQVRRGPGRLHAHRGRRRAGGLARRDKSYLFSPGGRAFLAYRVVAGSALVSGDPVGDERGFDALLAEMAALARAHGWRLAVLGASTDHLERYRRLGLRPIALGEEAVLQPATFTLEGRAIRKVRQSVSRVTKAGYGLRVVAAEDVGRREQTQLDEVSRLWLGNQPERGFSMSIDDLYAPGTLLALAEQEDGTVGGFLHLAPTPAGRGWSLSTMRRRPDTPNGLTEFLVVETLAWARTHEATELSLNFCAFTDILSRERAVTWPRRVLRRGLLSADGVFQLERLYAFNRKFFPEWRPRYVCVQKLSDLPLVGLAYLHVESLLVPPGPWVRRQRRAVAR
jgi:lysyl-tRNA synthetase class 2